MREKDRELARRRRRRKKAKKMNAKRAIQNKAGAGGPKK